MLRPVADLMLSILSSILVTMSAWRRERRFWGGRMDIVVVGALVRDKGRIEGLGMTLEGWAEVGANSPLFGENAG